MSSDVTVHACPVCSGRGHVSGGFYSGPLHALSLSETCQTCGGAGILRVGLFGSVTRVDGSKVECSADFTAARGIVTPPSDGSLPEDRVRSVRDDE